MIWCIVVHDHCTGPEMCVIAVMKIGDIKYGKIFSDRGVTGQSQNDQEVLGGEL